MKCAQQDVETRLLLLQGQIFAACRLGVWCFDAEKQLFQSTAPHQEEYHMFLRVGGALQLAIDLKDEDSIPYIINGTLGLAWISEWVHLQNGGRILIVLGPAYLKNTQMEDSMQELDRLGVFQHLRRQYLNVLGDVPVLSYDMLRQYACMLHYTCYQETVTPVTTAPLEKHPQERKGREAEAFADSNDYQRMAAYEEVLLHHLAKGTEPEDSPNQYGGELQSFGLNDSMRLIKDNLIIFTGLCARVAAKSGISVYTARTMENDWVKRIEAARSFSEARKLRESMYSAFLRQIRQRQDSTGLSRAIRECRLYIQTNYAKELTLEEIACHCGYAEYYLSRKFSKETGMKLGDYIHSVRIDAAKTMLLTTSKEIQEISDSLHFGNRNHFDRVFRQLVGISPARYREQGGQIQYLKKAATDGNGGAVK